MKATHIPLYLATAALVSTLTLSGCNKSTTPATTQNPTPAAQQPAANNPPAPPPDNSTPAPVASQPAPQAPAQAAAPPPPAQITIPAGTSIRVRLDQDLGSKISQEGESFDATVADDVVVHGQTVIPREARAEGVVIDAKSLGHFKGGALLELRLERVKTRWGSYPVSTSTMSQIEKGKGP
jgi:glucose/arabinose dehydrogenase